VLCLARLGNAKIAVQVDIGFGDEVFPGPVIADLPVMLDFDAPRLLCYPYGRPTRDVWFNGR